MNTKIEKLPENVVKVDIEVPAKDAVNYYNNAAKRLAQFVNIPGFRKGKAPRNVLEQHIGEERIKHEALENALPRIFADVVKENDFDVVAQPYVESYTFNVGEDLKISAKIELRPEVTLGEYKGLTIDVEEYKTPEDAFQKSIDNLLSQSAETVVVTDRNSEATDIVVFDFEGFANGEKIEHGDAKNYTLDLANSSFIPGFAEQLVGRPIGEDFEINVTFPETYHEKKLAGQPAVFKCKLHEIQTKELPTLDDDFAKDVSDFDTLEELKADAQKKLEERRVSVADDEVTEQIVNALVELLDADVPAAMYENEINESIREFEYRLQSQGLSLDMYMQYTGMDKDAFRESYREQAEKKVKLRLVLEKIAELEAIEPTAEEIEAEYTRMAEMYQIEPEKVKAFIPEDALKQDLAVQKAMDFVKENAKITNRKK